MTDRQARGTAGEAAVGDERTSLAETLRLQVARRIEHFLHAGAALRAFIADDDDVAGYDLVAEDALNGSVLAFEDLGRTGELQDRFIDAGRLHDAAVDRQIALEDGEAPILGEGMLRIADNALFAVEIKLFPARALAEGNLCRNAAGSGAEEFQSRLVVGNGNIPLRQRLAQRRSVDGWQVGVQQSRAVQLAEDCHDATGAMHVFHMNVGLGRRHLGKAGNAPRQAVDVIHGEIDFAFMGRSEDMQHCIGRAAHGDIERHGVLERTLAGDRPRQSRHIILLVIALWQRDDPATGLEEELLAIGMGRKRRSVAGQRQAEGFRQAVHRIGGEHARARAAGRTGGTLDDLNVFIADLVVGSRNHGINQVEGDLLAMQHDLAGFHRAAGHEDRRDVETQRGHQHAGGDLVAVRNADHGVGAMGVDHVFYAIGDEFARRQRIEHAVMPHGDAVIDRDGVEFLGNAARRFDFTRDELAEILEVYVAGHELGEGVDHSNDWLAKIAVLHTRRAPKAARAGHVAAVGGGSGTISWHGVFLVILEFARGRQGPKVSGRRGRRQLRFLELS